MEARSGHCYAARMAEHGRIARPGIRLSVAAALCRAASFAKEGFVAYLFGAGIVTDAYALAMLIPALGAALFVRAFCRSYLTLMAGEDAAPFARWFLGRVFWVSLPIPALVTVAVRFVPPGAVADLATPAAWLIVPSAMVAALTAVLNARGRFAAPQLTALIPTAAVAALLVAEGTRFGAAGLVHSLLAGTALQAVVLMGMGARAGSGIAPAAAATFWAGVLPMIAIDLMVQCNVFVDRAMAGTLPSGAVAVLTWSALMKDFLSTALVASVLAVLLPHFARQVASGRAGEIGNACALVIRYGAVLLLPVSALLCLCGPPLVASLRLGNLDAPAIRSMTLCLAAYGIGLYADLVSSTFFQGLLALRRLRALLWLGLLANVLPNVGLNLLLIGPMKEVGLALATSIVSFLTLAANFFVLRRHVPIPGGGARTVLGAALATAAASGAAYGAMKAMGSPWAGAGAFVAVYLGLSLGFIGDARRAVAMLRGYRSDS